MNKLLLAVAISAVCLQFLPAVAQQSSGKAISSANVSTTAAAEIGKKAPEFTLTDSHGKKQSLNEHEGKFVVLEWTNSGCPFVRKHYGSDNMQKLQEAYTKKGVIWLTICSSAPDKQGNMSPDEINKMLTEKNEHQTAYLIDASGKVGQLYGAKATPHMFIIDPNGILIYKGAIDDKPSVDPSDIASAHNYVKAALDEAMAGKPVSISSTRAYGCSVKYQ